MRSSRKGVKCLGRPVRCSENGSISQLWLHRLSDYSLWALKVPQLGFVMS